MIKIKTVFVFLFLTTIVSFSQSKLNDYKYIIVPNQYEFQKTADAFKINSLTKFLFEKAGFTTFLSTDSFPDDLAKNRCLALTAKLINGKGVFKTKMNFDLVNCNNQVVFSTHQAVTREKEYKKAYHEVIRKAFEDIKRQNYKYEPQTDVTAQEVVSNTEQKDKKEVNDSILKVTTTEDIQNLQTSKSDVLLYAQAIQNGFQLVDSTPKRVYTIHQTSAKNIYILKDKKGVLYKLNDVWIVEYYENGKLVKEQVQIKF